MRICPLNWCLTLIFLLTPWVVQAQASLFTSTAPAAMERSGPATRGIPVDGEVWHVTVDVATLRTAPEWLEIELPTGSTLWARKDHFEVDAVAGETDSRALRWWGRSDAGEDVLINVVEGQVAATVVARQGTFQLQPTGGEIHHWFRRAEVEDTCATPASVSRSLRSQAAVVSVEGVSVEGVSVEGVSVEGPASNKAPAVVDLMMVYSPAARDKLGGPAAVEALVRQDVDFTNRALANSLLDTRVRLIQVEETPFRGDGSTISAMTWVFTRFDKVRRDWGADVIGIIDAVTDYCGSARYRGLRGSLAGGFFVLNSNCFGGGVTAHELGHLWGADHNREDRGMPHGNEPDATYHDAYGLYHDGQYRTVMSYRGQCTLGCDRAPYFSNPAVSHLGLSTGIQNQAANHRVIDDYSPVVARFLAPQAAAPLAPSDLNAVLEATDTALQVRLTWNDRADKEGHYDLYRTVDQGGLTRHARLAKNQETFVDTEVEPGHTYRYQVEAVNLQGTARSEPTEVEVVALGAQLEALNQAPRAGELVSFELRVEGGARHALWNFRKESAPASNGFALSDAESGWDVGHLFATPGEYVVEVEVLGAFGQRVVEQVALTVGGEEPTWARQEARLQSVIHGPRGGGGVFETQLWLHNAGDAPVLADLAFLARGRDNRSARRSSITVQPGRTLHLTDVVSRLGAEGAGALSVEARVNAAHAEAQPRLLTFSRSFVAVPDGPEGASFGQSVGEEVAAEWSDEPRWIVGLYDGPEASTSPTTGWQATLHGVNLDDRPGRLTLELIDALGRPVGEPAELALPPQGMRFQRLIRLFPDARTHPAPFTARVSSNGIRFLASGTLLDSGSEDQVFLPAREIPSTAAESGLWIPRVVEGAGQFGVTLTTRLVLHNPTDMAQTYTLDLLERGQNNEVPLSVPLTVAAGETRQVGALLPSLFGVDSGAGALVIRGQESLPLAAAMVFARSDTGARFATRVAPRSPDEAAIDSAVDFGAEQSSRFTSAFGVVNLLESTTRLELILRDGNGVELARRSQNLRPRQHLERTLLGLFSSAGAGAIEGEDLTVETRVSAGGPVLTYLVNVNLSGDVFYVPGRTR